MTAPVESMALCSPKPLPRLLLSVDSEIMASLGAERTPLPLLSRVLSRKTCCQVVAAGKKSLPTAESGIACYHQRLSLAQPVGPASCQDLEQAGQAVAYAADEAHGQAAASERGDKERQNGLNDLTADVV